MLPIYVINLAREPQRLARIGAALDAFGLSWRRVEAIDRSLMPAAGLRAAFGGGRAARAFPATTGDMACSLTHRRAWEEIAGGTAEAAVVLEDDAALAAAFPAFVADDVARLMRDHGMGAMKLEFWPGPQRSRRFPLGQPLGPGPGGATLFRLRSGFLGTCGYVLTARAAGALLDRFPRMAVPVDHFLFGRAAGMGFDLIRPGFVNPAPVLHDVGTFGSDIGAERGAASRGIARRLRDWRTRRAEAAEIRAGRAFRVAMTFSGGTELFGLSCVDDGRSRPAQEETT